MPRGPLARPAGCFALIMREMTHLRRQSQFPSLCFSSFFQLHLPFPLTGGYECRFSAPRPFRREPDCARLSPLRPLSSDVATSPPSFLPQRPVPARVVGASMDYDYSFDSPRSPVFVEGGGASPTGWPLHRMTLQPWRIYDPSFRYHHSVYEGLNAHVLARDDGRDQRPDFSIFFFSKNQGASRLQAALP